MANRHGRFTASLPALLAVALLATLALCAGSAQAASTLPALDVSVSKTTIAVSGAEQTGAVNVVSTADKTAKEPVTVLFLLKPGVTVEEFTTALAGSNKIANDPNYANKYGSIVFDSEDHPGGTVEAQTELQLGTYVVMNAEAKKSSDWPKTSFTTVAAATPAALPAPEATVSSIEFNFRGPKTLKDGELVRFENAGFLVHMDIAFPVKSKKAAEKVMKDLHAGNEKNIEKLIAGAPFAFFGPMSSGGFQEETITAKPGYYVEVCFMMTQDGRPHPLLGMEHMIRIVK
jgi:hypothetical protein